MIHVIRYHESTFVLLVVRVVWKVNGIPANSTPAPVEPKLVGGGAEIGRINYLGGLTKRAQFQILQPSGGRLDNGVKYALLGAFFYRLRSHGASNRRAYCSKTQVLMQGSALWGLVDT